MGLQLRYRNQLISRLGYSNSKYSEAEIAFANGELQVGRRALATSDVQSFYGMSIYNNGTAAFTNTLAGESKTLEFRVKCVLMIL